MRSGMSIYLLQCTESKKLSSNRRNGYVSATPDLRSGSGARATFGELPRPVAFKGTFDKPGNYALQSEDHQAEVALTAASIPSLSRHESPIPDKFPSLFHSLGAPHKG